MRSADQTDAYVGRRIAARRVALGLSQGAVASAVGISVQQLQKYEAALNRVSASRLAALAAALGAAPADFFPPMDAGEPPPALSGAAERLGQAFDRIADPALRHALSRIVATLGAGAPA